MRGLLLLMLTCALAPQLAAQAPPDTPSGAPLPHSAWSAKLYLQADVLIYEARGNRVIARGSVEMYYDSYILTGDEVIYDGGMNKLIVHGNAQLKDPSGSITRADRIEAGDDLRDAFARELLNSKAMPP